MVESAEPLRKRRGRPRRRGLAPGDPIPDLNRPLREFSGRKEGDRNTVGA